ncbi:MAG: eCIS core domain-containing protein, partial [Pyrinomonadaceae bacterium]
MLQRQCACGSRSESGGECTECAEKDRLRQRKATVDRRSQVPEIVYDVLRTSGQPLESESRTFMEARFGYDFSGVRIHTDTDAHRSAEATTSDAYTVGRDIVFAPGQYAPHTTVGRRLLAHELAHVVQQNSSTDTSRNIELGRTDEHEADADSAADGALSRDDAPALVSPANISLQRQESGSTATAQPTQASTAAAVTSPCIEEVVGENISSLLEAGVVTIIEFGAHWCAPCRQNKAALETICRQFRAQPPPVTVRFYSIDVEVEANKVLSEPYTPGKIPHLYFYVGSTEKSHYINGIELPAMEQIVAEHVAYASTSGAWQGAKRGMKWGLGLGLPAALIAGIKTESLGLV